MNMMVDGACRNALAFIAKRYGVSRQQIVEVAPLLFFIAAEQSLQERKKRLNAFQNAFGTAEAALPSGLIPDSFYSSQDDAFHAEQESIKARDLFGAKSYHHVKDGSTENPFANFLTEQLKTVNPKSKSVQWYSDDAPLYLICIDDVLSYVGNDKDAAKMILKGWVTLHDMPAEVRKSSGQERAIWVRKCWAEITNIGEDFSSDLEDIMTYLEEQLSRPPAAEDDL